MGLSFSRRKKVGKRTTANVSKSGVSVSRKAGPISVNSRGKGSLKLGKGFRIKF